MKNDGAGGYFLHRAGGLYKRQHEIGSCFCNLTFNATCYRDTKLMFLYKKKYCKKKAAYY